MALVHLLTPEDNAAAAPATAQVTAQRIGNALRERFQDYIHKRECAPDSQDYNIKMASRAIGAFAVCQLGNADDVSAGKSVCDSSEDGGIDAIFVNHSEKCVVVVQAKYNQSGKATWTIDDFLRFKNACEYLQQNQLARFDPILQALNSDIETALNSIDYTFKFVMAHTGKRGAAAPILKDMQSWQDELNVAAIVPDGTPANELPFQVHLVSAEDLVEWMRIQHSSTVDLKDVELEQYGKVNEPLQAFYGVISGDQINEWWLEHSSTLFTKNIRNLLGKTEVNESIRDTALNNPQHFWFYNNGITVLVRGVTPHRRNSERDRTHGRFSFQDISVINGAQTVSSIGYIGQQKPEILPDIKVHVRFILVPQSADNEITNSITRANNHQNRVLGRDFASQHGEQLRLRDELIIEGYSYQLLRSDTKPVDDEYTIDIDEALDGLACLTKNPTTLATLKSGRGKFFDNLEGSQYKTIFNPTVTGIKLINAVKHGRFIESIIKQKLAETDYATEKKRYGILTHANRVFASELMNGIPSIKNATTIIEVDEDALKERFEVVLTSTEELIETHYPTAYPARFFSNVQKISTMLTYYSDGTVPDQDA